MLESPTSHMIILLSHLVVLLFFFKFDSIILILRSTISYVTVFLLHLMVLLFFLTFDSTILTLYSTNITCDCAFVTFVGSLIFSHIWWYHPHIMQYQHHMSLYFCHIWWFPYFFLTSDSIILTLCSTNIICNCTFVTLGDSFIFFHIWWYHPHIV